MKKMTANAADGQFHLTEEGITDVLTTLLLEMGDECPVPDCLKSVAESLRREHDSGAGVSAMRISEESAKLRASVGSSIEVDVWMSQTAYKWLQREREQRKGIIEDPERLSIQILVAAFYLTYSKLMKKRGA